MLAQNVRGFFDDWSVFGDAVVSEVRNGLEVMVSLKLEVFSAIISFKNYGQHLIGAF